jgi:peptidylprolyl isomerase
MDKRRPHFVPGASVRDEMLERRVMLSGAGAGGMAEVARAATKTTLTASTGTLGQPVQLTVTVRGAAAAGSPAGTVEIVDHGNVLGTMTLSPTISTNRRYASSAAVGTMSQMPGGAAYYFGRHQLSAVYVPAGSDSRSSGSAVLTVHQPAYTALPGGVKVATVVQGSGPEIQPGQTASVLYTGYLAKSGEIFDDSINDGGSPFGFTLGAGQVVPGFDGGTTGMTVGETRVIMIPPAEGYGTKANGPIPANSTLVFVVTLESIS